LFKTPRARTRYRRGMTQGAHHDGAALIANAAAEAARVVNTIPADQDMNVLTPCTEWDLRTLLNHTILWTAYSAEQRAYGKSVADDLMSKDFAAEPGYAADYEEQIGRAVKAWSDPAAWDRELGVMGASTKAADIAAMLIAEMVLHGWDIARATGQEYRSDEAVAANVLTTVQAQGELFRKYQGFADIIAVPDTASTLDRALALSGRDPGWRP
jgi:uncharacterized protein (TIGR03086 family)